MSVEVAVFVAYFSVVLVIGVWALRRSESEAEYWIAGGNLGWLTGGATLAATHASAGTFIGTIGVMHSTGWAFGWLVLSIPIAYWFLAAVLAPRFVAVPELTLPGFLERRYSSQGVRSVAAVIILIATVVYVQAQIVAGGLIAEVIFGIPSRTGMVGFALFLVLYTMVGGMLAVVYTDLLQLTVMFFGALLAVPIALRHVGGVGELFEKVQIAKPEVFSWTSMPPTLLLTMGLAFTLGSISTPEKLIRLYTMKDLRTLRRGVLFALILATVMNFFVMTLALVSIVELPDLPSGDLAMPMLAKTLLPPVLGALLLAAIVAAMMSTVDSLLLVAGSALSRDLYANLLRKEAGERERQWVNRLGVTVVGLAPVALVLSGVGEGELVQFIVLLFTALMASSFFAPVVLGVFWRRANAPGAIAAMLGGCAATFLWKAFGTPTLDPVLPGCAVSLVLFVAVSLATADDANSSESA
ncbi:MAG: sodium/solute symporter [Acidobacteriota bacterium]